MAKKVLIVEDNELNMKLFHDLLDAQGYETLQTREGLQALALALQAGVVILTNAPGAGRAGRVRWLVQHGFDYPMIVNSGLKGPAVAALERLSRDAELLILSNAPAPGAGSILSQWSEKKVSNSTLPSARSRCSVAPGR